MHDEEEKNLAMFLPGFGSVAGIFVEDIPETLKGEKHNTFEVKCTDLSHFHSKFKVNNKGHNKY